MNGNLKLIDNGKRQNGKHVEFTMCQNAAYALVKDDPAALSVYMFLRFCAGSEFNVTADNVSKEIKIGAKTVRKAFKKLESLWLLKREYDRDLTGKSQIKKRNGKKVPNNTLHYTIYAVPVPPADIASTVPAMQQNTIIVNKPIIVDQPFTTEDFESGSDVPADMKEYQPEPVQAVKPVRAEVSAEKQQGIDKLAEEMRIRHINDIAKGNYLFGGNIDKLHYWDKQFCKVTGRKTDDDCLNFMAMKLSGNSNENLTGFIRQKALAYSAE